MKKQLPDELLAEYSDAAAQQSRERGARPTPAAQPRQGKVERVMRGDPASRIPIDTRRELYERLQELAPALHIRSITRRGARRKP